MVGYVPWCPTMPAWIFRPWVKTHRKNKCFHTYIYILRSIHIYHGQPWLAPWYMYDGTSRETKPSVSMVTFMGHPMAGLHPMDSSIDTPVRWSVHCWPHGTCHEHWPFIIDRIFNGRAHGTPHCHSAHHGTRHYIMACTTIFHARCVIWSSPRRENLWLL